MSAQAPADLFVEWLFVRNRGGPEWHTFSPFFTSGLTEFAQVLFDFEDKGLIVRHDERCRVKSCQGLFKRHYAGNWFQEPHFVFSRKGRKELATAVMLVGLRRST